MGGKGAEDVSVLGWETSLVPQKSKDPGSEMNHGQGLGFEACAVHPASSPDFPPEWEGLVGRPGTGFSSGEGEAARPQEAPATCWAGAGCHAHSIPSNPHAPRETALAVSISQMGTLRPRDTE